MRDLHHNVKASVALNPTSFSSNVAANGAIIDTQGFQSVEFALHSGTITNGTYAPSFTEGDAANLSDASAVAAADLFGAVADATFTGSTDSDKAKRIGYHGAKRYVRLTLTPSGVTGYATGTATIVSAVATNKVTIAGHDFTAIANGGTPSGDQWAVGAGGTADADSATALAAAINNSVTVGIAGVVTASAAANVVTIAAVSAGTAGNSITLAKTGTPITVSGSGTLASGAAGGGSLSALVIQGHPVSAPVA